MIEIDEDLRRFKERLSSQSEMIKDGHLQCPDKDLIEEGKQYYSRLNLDEKEMFAELIKAWDKRPKRRIYSTTTK